MCYSPWDPKSQTQLSDSTTTTRGDILLTADLVESKTDAKYVDLQRL